MQTSPRDRLGTDRIGPSRARDHGSSLVEVLVAVVLLGMLVGAVMGGLSLAISLGNRTTTRAKADAAVVAVTDRLTAAPYIACPTTSGSSSYMPVVEGAAATVSWPASSVRILAMEYWRPTGPDTGAWQATNDLSAGECASPGGLTTSRVMQRIRVEVLSPDGQIRRTTEVVKTNALTSR